MSEEISGEPLDGRAAARESARARAIALRDQEAQMLRLAETEPLAQRRQVYVGAARRFAALAELEEAVAKPGARSWDHL